MNESGIVEHIGFNLILDKDNGTNMWYCKLFKFSSKKTICKWCFSFFKVVKFDITFAFAHRKGDTFPLAAYSTV